MNGFSVCPVSAGAVCRMPTIWIWSSDPVGGQDGAAPVVRHVRLVSRRIALIAAVLALPPGADRSLQRCYIFLGQLPGQGRIVQGPRVGELAGRHPGPEGPH